MPALETWWAAATQKQRLSLKEYLPMLKTIAESADQARNDWDSTKEEAP